MLKTKLNKPIPASKLIFRKELIDKLETGKNKKLALVSAPAGYGKSTLISQWIDHCSCSYSWYSLDISDNDINTFLQYTIAGIQSVYTDVGVAAVNLLESKSNPTFETITTQIINDLYEIKEHFYIIFDDYHLIENQQINKLIFFLLDNLPENIQIVLITRSDPSIPLSRLRSQQMVTDIRLSDLCFNANNVYDFFKKCLNINLSIDDAKSLESKTEGWIAGLQLTGLSLQGREDIGNFVNKLKGDNRYIMDYLIEEVLQQHAQEIREFLLCTSILNQFNASLCNHVLNIQNGQEIIELLERKNMFIIPLDNERNWFRYHHLFASLLQHRLGVRLKDRIPELHANSSQWFENNDQLILALEHALIAGDKEKALNLFTGTIDRLWETSQFDLILKFGEMFTLEELVENSETCFVYFWVLFESGILERAELLITKLQDQTTDKVELAKVYVCLNNLKAFTGDIESAFKYAELATQNISEDDVWWNGLAFFSQGESHLLRLELTKSLQSFMRTGQIATEANILYLKLISLARASYVLWLMGKYSEAYSLSKDLLEDFKAKTADFPGIELISGLLYSQIGSYQVGLNYIEEGLQNAKIGYELSKKTNNGGFIASCKLMLANAYYLAEDFEKATNHIEALDALPFKKAMKFVFILSDSLKSRLYYITNNQDKLESLNQRNINSDNNHAFENFGHSMHKARCLVAKGMHIKATGLLQEIAEDLKPKRAHGLLTEVNLLQARVHFLIQQEEMAIESLTIAICQTQKIGLIRMYVIEGEYVEILLKEMKRLKINKSNKQLDSIDIEYINKILSVFKKENRLPKIIPDQELSSRELDTLKLIAGDLSNQEIANQLYVSINTVKTHVRNILLKLEAKNRNEAVVKAKEKGILHS